MNIPRDEWAKASGSYVQDDRGNLLQIIGFIDRPAVIMRPVIGDGHQIVQIMGSETSKQYHRLVRKDEA